MNIFKKLNNTHYALIVIFLVLLVDQVLKIYIKTNFYEGKEVSVFGEWFTLHFIENEGMAFGLKFGGKIGKIILTSFRILASVLIVLYMRSLIKKKVPVGLIISIALIFAGATGNIIDSVFYGQFFTSSVGQVAEFAPGNGYAPILQGKVVDMLQFEIIRGQYPDWFPGRMSGRPFTFFGPIFNLADSAITTGVLIILVFQKRFFKNIENFS